MELGDTQAAVEATKIASLAIENDRLSQAKLQQEQRAQVVEQPQQVQQQPQQMRRLIKSRGLGTTKRVVWTR